MRHGDKINNLGRPSYNRKAFLSNMACSLIEHKRIFTKLAKAKALRLFVEPIITTSKNDTTHARRMAFADLKSKDAVSTLFKDIAVKVGDRKGGYTRIIKTGNRQGDAAEMALIELVDYNEIYTNGKGSAKPEKAKTTRRSRATKKKADGADTAETKTEE